MRSHALQIAATAALLLSLVTTVDGVQREHRVTDTFPTAEGKRVMVDAATLDVHVRAADVHQLEVTTDLRISGVKQERAEGWIESHTPTFVDEARQLTMTAQPGKTGFMGLGILTAKARLSLVLPTDVIPDVTTTTGSVSIRGDFPLARPLMLRTAKGSLELVGATTALDIRSASGDSNVEVVRPLLRLFARTSSGDVILSGGAREVEVDTASGAIRLDNLSGSARVETSSGKINLRWDRLDADSTVKVKSSSSRIHLIIPPSVKPRGTLTTSGGTVRCDFPGTVNETGDTVHLEGDGPLLEIESTSGEILVSTGGEWEEPTSTSP